MPITQEEFNTLMANWIAENGGQYNSAHTGQQIDAAVTAVRNKEATWDAASAGGGVSVPTAGFVSLGVEADGILYAYTADDTAVPQFEYDEATGELYYVTDEEVA